MWQRKDRQLAAAAVSVRPLAGTGAHHKVHPGLAVWLGHHTWDERAPACGAGRERPLDLAGYKIRRAVGGLRGKGHPQFSLRSTLRNWKYQGNLQGARSTGNGLARFPSYGTMSSDNSDTERKFDGSDKSKWKAFHGDAVRLSAGRVQLGSAGQVQKM